MTQIVDITPTPRILRTLGDIPFDIWQCFAELADNSLDVFRTEENSGNKIENARLDIHWSNETTPPMEREIVVEDNGSGMSLDLLRNAARAGFSNNDPIHNLGLFGMGFNIATARLGDETRFFSATKDSKEWVGIKIDFTELIKNQTFEAPVITLPKDFPEETGTKVIIRRLKDGVFSEARRKEGSTRRRLEVIYTPILERESVDIFLQGKRLRPHPHCVWGGTRYVVRKGEKTFAIQNIDRDLGETWFDISRNRYLSEDEAADYANREYQGDNIPVNIVKRARRLKGWVGIQRYSDPSDFGIDFIRNGRKIIVADKSIFGFENPDTGTFVSEYPVELGTTVGGRIVGELNVDYLIPTYQKNGFDTTGRPWKLTMDAVRGCGPILPKKRKAFGYDGDNCSPLGLLVNAYRRADPGTKNLSLPSGISRGLLKEYRAKKPEYLPDDKWYKAAQDSDRDKGVSTTPVNFGQTTTDDPDNYAPPTAESESQKSVVLPPINPPSPKSTVNTSRDVLINNSEHVEGLCGEYKYGNTPALKVVAWRTKSLQIKHDSERTPFVIFQDGIEIDFFFDDTHPVLAEYPISPKQLLLQGLAEKFSVRDHGLSIHKAFLGLVENHLADERINSQILKDRAQAILSNITDGLPQLLDDRFNKALEIIKAVSSEEEALASNLLEEAPDLLLEYQEHGDRAVESLSYVPTETLIRLVEEMPEEFLDGKVFSLPYSQIVIGSPDTTLHLRRTVLDRIISYLKDVKTLLKEGGTSPTKYELIRYANTLAILEERLA